MSRSASNVDKSQFKNVLCPVPLTMYDDLKEQADRRANDEGNYVSVGRIMVEHVRNMMKRVRKFHANGASGKKKK